MLIKLPKKLKHLIALRGTELLMEANEEGFECETPKFLRKTLAKLVYIRADRYKEMTEAIIEAYDIINSVRDIEIVSDDLMTMNLTEYLESDYETKIEDDILRLFKNEEFGIWVLEHLTGDRIF